MTALLADLFVSLGLTFALSRLLLRMTQRWFNSVVRLVAVHIVSLVLCVVAATWFFEGGAGRTISVVVVFAPGELAWLLIDAFRLVHRREKEQPREP
jgi:hypothetical protein